MNVKKEKVCFTVVVLDITLPTAAAHIHEGEVGVAGDIVVTLEAPEEVSGFRRRVGDQMGPRSVEATSEGHQEQPRSVLRQRPHISDFPDGAVRGQLSLA